MSLFLFLVSGIVLGLGLVYRVVEVLVELLLREHVKVCSGCILRVHRFQYKSSSLFRFGWYLPRSVFVKRVYL